MLSLRPMTEDDLPAVEHWLSLVHVARWWPPDTTPQQETLKYRHRINGTSSRPTTMLTITWADSPIGWCQWYRWADHPAEAAAVGAREGELGIDYAIGDPARIGHGIGTLLIAALVAEGRRHHPGAGVVTAPEAANIASRRVLEKNGFQLLAVGPVVTEPTDAPMAIYRLAPTV